MESEADISQEEDDELKELETEDVKEGKKSKGKKKKKKKKKQKKVKLPKDMVMNERGEIVPAREYILEKTSATNEDLQDMLVEQEKDALQVISALHRDSERKDNQIREIQLAMKKLEEDSKLQIEAVKKACDAKMEDTLANLNEKEQAFKIMQQEFAVIKDFRRKRQELLKALDDSKLELEDTEKRHRDIITRMEKKFFSEKIRLQNEANQKIDDLASQAHKEAVSNLDVTTKDVYKENIRISDALLFHVREGEELNKIITKLTAANQELLQEKELHSVIVKEKILQSKQQEAEVILSNQIKELKKLISQMEHSLTHVVKEFEQERKMIGEIAKKELEAIKEVVQDLTGKLATKAIEMRHIKRLAQHILDQRTEMEDFFMQSLEEVKSQLNAKRMQELKLNQLKYKQSIKDVCYTNQALKPKALIPPLKPLRLTKDVEIKNMLFATPEDSLDDNKDKVTLQDLGWEDKEKVLRILFAKMNGVSLENESDRIKKSRMELEQEMKRKASFGNAIVPVEQSLVS